MATKAISALTTPYATLQAGDYFAVDRAGVTGKTTFAELAAEVVDEVEAGALTVTGNWTVSGNWTFAGTTIADLGTVTTADINGGTIDGTTIGGTTPAAGSFTSLSATNDIQISEATPTVFFYDTDEPVARRGTSIQRNGLTFIIATRDSDGNLVTSDYVLTTSNSGATEHSFRILGTEILGVDSSGITVTGVSTLDGTANTENVLPQTANTYDLGATASGLTVRRYRNIYLQNAPDVSSDARLKDNIQNLTDAERRAAAKIKARTFTMRDTGKKKVGYIAQEIIEAMASEGLDAFEYGLVSDGETYGVDYDAINAFRLG